MVAKGGKPDRSRRTPSAANRLWAPEREEVPLPQKCLWDRMCFRNCQSDTESPDIGKIQQVLKGRCHVC